MEPPKPIRRFLTSYGSYIPNESRKTIWLEERSQRLLFRVLKFMDHLRVVVRQLHVTVLIFWFLVRSLSVHWHPHFQACFQVSACSPCLKYVSTGTSTGPPNSASAQSLLTSWLHSIYLRTYYWQIRVRLRNPHPNSYSTTSSFSSPHIIVEFLHRSSQSYLGKTSILWISFSGSKFSSRRTPSVYRDLGRLPIYTGITLPRRSSNIICL